MEDKLYGQLLSLHRLSFRENTKPVLPGIRKLPKEDILRVCFEFAEDMYRISKLESYGE